MKYLKIFLLSIVAASVLFVTGCGKEKNVEGTLEEIMDKVYADVAEEDTPMMLMNTKITEENVEYYLGSKIEFDEAIVSESAVGSIAHSVALIRVNDKADIESIKKEIKDNANPRKWICVEAETVEVASKGNLIILIMSSEKNAETILNTFNSL